MGRCINCKHWGTDRSMHIDKWQTCRDSKDWVVTSAKDAMPEVNALIWTQGDFGCTRFERSRRAVKAA